MEMSGTCWIRDDVTHSWEGLLHVHRSESDRSSLSWTRLGVKGTRNEIRTLGCQTEPGSGLFRYLLPLERKELQGTAAADVIYFNPHKEQLVTRCTRTHYYDTVVRPDMGQLDQVTMESCTTGNARKMTTISPAENAFMKRDNQESMEDDIFYMYGSTVTHIKEETEYVRTIRATLEKIQSQLFKDDLYSKSTQEKNSSHIKQNGHNREEDDSFSSRYKRILEKLKDQDLKVLDAHRENEDLQIKLEATREAGAGAIRDATRKLYENYNKRSEQLQKSHEEEKQHLQVSAAEHEDRLKKSIANLNDVAEKIQEKHSRIFELEKLMERMEAENASLVEKKRFLENELSRRMADPANAKGSLSIQDEVFTVEEQINHLQKLMMSQHQHLRTLIQEIEELKARLKEQDATIGELKEKVSFLECQNKELKYKVEHWTDPSKIKVTKTTCVNESMLRTSTPYYMLMKHKNS